VNGERNGTLSDKLGSRIVDKMKVYFPEPSLPLLLKRKPMSGSSSDLLGSVHLRRIRPVGRLSHYHYSTAKDVGTIGAMSAAGNGVKNAYKSAGNIQET
jgi:hypothetical protein